MGIFPNILPDAFSIEEAADLLDWQGTLPGLSHSLMADGFVKFRASATVNSPSRFMWRKPIPTTAPDQCTCRCHTGTCGANDMDLAERSLRLVEAMGIRDGETITVLDDLVSRAGVDYAKAALKFGNLDSDVPF